MREGRVFLRGLAPRGLGTLDGGFFLTVGRCLIDGIRLFRLDVRLRILVRCRPVLRIVRLPGFVHRLGIVDRRWGWGRGAEIVVPWKICHR